MLEIEITALNEIDGGIEVFARAWRDGQQIGFSKDGTVDIERFRFFNPPVLVPDENGDVIRDIYDPDEDVTTQRTYREDPEEALLQMLEQAINAVGKDGVNIIEGKVGKTTSTFYPEAGSGGGNTTFDGAYFQDAAWTTAQQATTATETDDTSANFQTATTAGLAKVRRRPSSWQILRSIMTFDTSAIGTDTIDSATLSLYMVTLFTSVATGTNDIYITDANPASNNSATAADFNDIGTVSDPSSGSYSSLDVTAMTASQYEDFVFNATGKAAINGSGVTAIGARSGEDKTAEPSGFVSGNQNGVIASAADTTGTTQDPKLVVVHTAGATSNIKSIAGITQANIKSIAGITNANIKSVAGVTNT